MTRAIYFIILIVIFSCQGLSNKKISKNDFIYDTTINLPRNFTEFDVDNRQYKIYEKYIISDTTLVPIEIKVLGFDRMLMNIQSHESNELYRLYGDSYAKPKNNPCQRMYENLLTLVRTEIQKYPESDGLYGVSGHIKLVLKDYNDAILDYNKAIQLNNKNGNYYEYKGLCFEWLHNKMEACTCFKQARDLGVNIEQKQINQNCY